MQGFIQFVHEDDFPETFCLFLNWNPPFEQPSNWDYKKESGSFI